MKTFTITCTHFKKGVTDNGYILTNIDDFIEYHDISSEINSQKISSAIRSDVPVEKWDHIEGIVGIGANMAKVTGRSPIIEANIMLTAKQENIHNMIMDGKKVFINMNGGYNEFNDSTHKIISEYIIDKSDNITISPDCKYMILENDSIIERRAIDFFTKNNMSLSYLVNLRKFSKDELIDIFDQFKNVGGDGIYVYTTGCDVNQAKMYIDAISESSISKLIIEFTTSHNKLNKSDICEYASEKLTNFKCI